MFPDRKLTCLCRSRFFRLDQENLQQLNVRNVFEQGKVFEKCLVWVKQLPVEEQNRQDYNMSIVRTVNKSVDALRKASIRLPLYQDNAGKQTQQ